MKPVAIHADGTDCHHEGPPARIAEDGARAECSAGVTVTHVRFSGRELTLAEASQAIEQIGRQFATMLNPVIAQFALLVNELAKSPGIRIAAQAAAAIEAERETEALGTDR